MLATALLASCTGAIDEGRVGNLPAGSGPENRQKPGDLGGASNPGSGSATRPPGGTGPGAPAPFTPAVAPLRRLTREQYDNVIRDLLGLDAGAVRAFSADELDGGFRGNAKVPVKELQVEQYAAAAEDLAARAVANLSRLVPCVPPAMAEDACVDVFVRGFGRRAFRRPLTAAEIERYRGLFASGRTGADFAAGVSLVVQAMLQSPHFLYRPEPGLPARAGAVPLSAFELASRLSFLVWNSMPDDELLAAADRDELGTPAQIAAQVRRLLADDRAGRALASFVEQWLELQDLPLVERSAAAFPLFSPAVRAAMREEVRRFVDHVVRQGDGRLATLLTAPVSVVNGALRPLYGLPPAANDAWTPVELPPSQRAGVLSLPGVMTVHAHADQTSLVKRGFLVRARLLCTIPPPPPPDVDNAPPQVNPALSARARFEQHRANPACAGCHTLMDPLGAPFEVYDSIGRYRTMDGPHPVDASGAITGTAGSDGPVNEPITLVRRLADADEVRACLVTQWFRFAHGRVEEQDDAGTLAAARQAFASSDFRLPELLIALATSEGFRARKAHGPARTP